MCFQDTLAWKRPARLSVDISESSWVEIFRHQAMLLIIEVGYITKSVG